MGFILISIIVLFIVGFVVAFKEYGITNLSNVKSGKKYLEDNEYLEDDIINPATGLFMVDGVDTNGNLYGSSN